MVYLREEAAKQPNPEVIYNVIDIYFWMLQIREIQECSSRNAGIFADYHDNDIKSMPNDLLSFLLN